MSIHLPTIFSKKRTYPCEDSAPFECYFIVSMMRDLLAQYNDDNFFFLILIFIILPKAFDIIFDDILYL